MTASERLSKVLDRFNAAPARRVVLDQSDPDFTLTIGDLRAVEAEIKALRDDRNQLRREAALTIATDLHGETGAVERLRVFAVHGDSSIFDQADAALVARLVSDGYQWRAKAIGLRTQVGLAIGELSAPYESVEAASEVDLLIRNLRRALED